MSKFNFAAALEELHGYVNSGQIPADLPQKTLTDFIKGIEGGNSPAEGLRAYLDITSEFPPKRQEMFLLILLHSNPSRYEK
ncbi:MAG TPA: hypothetical protein VHO28_06220, partial [Ignavibacteriales bacterium]|nr:hypothetical protein [Ignavibacteriales bacterium]